MSDKTTDKEKEKPGGAVPGWMSGAAKVGTGRAASGGVAGAGFGAKGLMGLKLGALFSSKAGFAGLVAIGLAVGGGLSYNEIQNAKRAETSAQFSNAIAGSSRDTGDAPVAGRSSVGASALALAQSANKGLYGSAEEETGETDADAVASADGEVPADAEGGEIGKTDSKGDPMEMAESMKEEQASKAAKAGLGKRFGRMSAGTGGGGRMQLAGGAGMSGGIGGKFNKKVLSNQRLKAMSKGRKAGVARSKTAARGRSSSLKGVNARRLDRMNRAMGGASRGSAAETAAVHTAQWDGAQPGGQALQGAGAGGISGGDSTFEGGEGTGNGDPISSPSGGGTSADTSTPGTGGGTNVTPYQGTIDTIIMMTLVAWTLLFIAGLLSDGQFTKPLAIAVAAFAIVIGVAAIAAGASIGDKYGQGDQANLLIFNGAGLVAAGAIAISGGETAVKISKYMQWIALVGMALSMSNYLM